jgi:4-amino-4-deoxy-L-arabinose transferase-like glycosyltransferase
MEGSPKNNVYFNHKWFKNNWNWLLLIAILVFGFYLRSYHLDYPVVGYHNMKEAHTLGEAWLMHENGNFLNNQLIYNTNFENPQGIHLDNLPVISWFLMVLWNLFGVHLWIARLLMVFFSLGVISLSYLVIKKLFDKEKLALLSAFLVAVCPLLVFFGRNVQYDIPALFFALFSVYFFLRWREKNKQTDIVFFSLFMVLTAITKLPFLIFLVPILAIFPYDRIKSDILTRKYSRIKHYLYSGVIFLIIPLFIFYSKYLDKIFLNPAGIKPFALENLGILFTSGFWKTIYSYAVIDNFTGFGLLFAFFGLILVIPRFRKWNFRFLFAWALSYIIYAAFSPPQMTGHNYYQIPYAPLIMFLVAYAFLFLLNSILSLVKGVKIKKVALIVVLVLILFLWYPSLELSADRQFNTQFFGLDVAGEYINKNSHSNEAVFESGHQDRGVAWHAKRRLAEFRNVDELKAGEKELNIKWIFMYQWGLSLIQDEEFMEHLENNYHLAQVALQRNGESNQVLYVLLKKGGTFKLNDIEALTQSKDPLIKEYELTSGIVPVFYYNAN